MPDVEAIWWQSDDTTWVWEKGCVFNPHANEHGRVYQQTPGVHQTGTV